MNETDADSATTHRLAAEQHLEQCNSSDPAAAAHHLGAAQVHATLALAAECRTMNLLTAAAADFSTQGRGLDQIISERLHLDEL